MKLKGLRELKFYKEPIVTLENMPDGYVGMVYAPYIPVMMTPMIAPIVVAFAFDNLGYDTLEFAVEGCTTHVEHLHEPLRMGLTAPPVMINRGVRSDITITMSRNQEPICNRIIDYFYTDNRKFDMRITRYAPIGVTLSKTFVKGCFISEIEHFPDDLMTLKIIPDYIEHQIEYGQQDQHNLQHAEA